jgi:hypothetical protein
LYHRIVPLAEAGNSISGLVVPPDRFDAQLTALAGAGWHTITMAPHATDLQSMARLAEDPGKPSGVRTLRDWPAPYLGIRDHQVMVRWPSDGEIDAHPQRDWVA